MTLLRFTTALLITVGCSNGGNNNVCVPGQSIACTGAGGCSGGQMCNSTGSAYGACECSSNDAGIEGGLDGGSDASDGGGPLTIASIRKNQPANGTSVYVPGVIVVAHVTSKTVGNIWLQDQGGGPYSGIEVSCAYGGTSPNCSLTQAQIDALTIGAVVDVHGTFTIYTPTVPTGAPSRLELTSPSITDLGKTVAPVALTVAASAVARDQWGQASDAYKGVYVNETAGGPYPVSSTTATEFQTACPNDAGTTYNGFEASNGSTLAITLAFYDTLTLCMPGCGSPCSNAVTNSLSFTSVAGIVESAANPNGSTYLGISPTADSDVPH